MQTQVCFSSLYHIHFFGIYSYPLFAFNANWRDKKFCLELKRLREWFELCVSIQFSIDLV